MSPARTRRGIFWTLVVGGGTLALFIQIAAAVDFDGRSVIDVVRAESTHEVVVPRAVTPVALPVPAVESLVCFECHNIDRFKTGEDFAHSDHEDYWGHCHLCHAFADHFRSTIRGETCEECH